MLGRQIKFWAHGYQPVEINLAVYLAVPGEAFLIEDVPAVDTADTVWVPGLVEDSEDVLVQDRLLARRADHQHRVQEGHQQPVDEELRELASVSSLLQNDDSFIHNSSDWTILSWVE